MREEFKQDWWKGRIDQEDGESGLRWHQMVKKYDVENGKGFVFVGFSSDEGVRRNKGRVGASKAPNEIRKFISGIPYHCKGMILQDVGNVICDGERLEEAREQQVDVVSQLIVEGQKVVVLGGGHEVAFGDFWALSKSKKNIGIINIDAHFDLRKPSPLTTSGTGFYEMAEVCVREKRDFKYLCIGIQKFGNTKVLFDKADELGCKYILADEVHEGKDWEENLMNFIDSVDCIYLTLDMDVFDVSFAPGVSATCINGVTPMQVKGMLKIIGTSGKLSLMDVAEVNPTYDIDGRTSKLAAQMIASLIEMWK